MTKRVEVHLPDELYQQIKKLDGTLSKNVRHAVTDFLQEDTVKTTVKPDTELDNEFKAYMQQDVKFLRDQVRILTETMQARMESTDDHIEKIYTMMQQAQILQAPEKKTTIKYDVSTPKPVTKPKDDITDIKKKVDEITKEKPKKKEKRGILSYFRM